MTRQSRWTLLTLLWLTSCGADSESDSKPVHPEDCPADTAAPASDTAAADTGIDTGTPPDDSSCATLSWPEHIPVAASTVRPVDGNRSEPWTTVLDPDATGAVVIGVWSEDEDVGPDVCYQLDSLTADGEVWVHLPTDPIDRGLACLSCPERVAVRQGAGWFVLRNSGATGPVSELTLQVGIRDCETGAPALTELGDTIPETVTVAMGRLESEPDTPIRIPIHLVNASSFDLAALTDSTAAAATAHLSPAGLTAEISMTTRLSPGDTTATYEGANRLGLRAILSAAMDARSEGDDAPEAALPVVLVDCLQETGLAAGTAEALTTAIPGVPAHACSQDAIFLRVGQCTGTEPTAYPWTDDSLGKVLAHEIGHFLGLYHSVESDGTEDHLTDTDENNLMNFATLSSTSSGLSASQISVLQVHAYLLGSTSASD